MLINNMDYTFNPILGLDFGNKFIKAARWNGNKTEVYCPNGEYLFRSSEVKSKLKNQNPHIIDDNKACLAIKYSCELINQSILNISSMFPKDKFVPHSVTIAVPSNFYPWEYSNYKEICKTLNYNQVFLIPEYVANLFSNGIILEESINKKYSNKEEFISKEEYTDKEQCANKEEYGEEENILSAIFNYESIDLNLLKVKKGENYIEIKEEFQHNLINLGNKFMDDEFIKYILDREKINIDEASSELISEIVRLRNKLIFSNKAYLEYGMYKEFTKFDMEQAMEIYIEALTKELNSIRTGLEAKNIDMKIDRIMLSGNSSNIDALIDILKKIFCCENICVPKNPQYSIAEGAAVYGGYIEKNKVILKNISEKGYGVIDGNGKYIPFIEEYSKIPCEKVLCFTTDTNDMVETELLIVDNKGNEIDKIEIRNILKKYKGYLDFFVKFKLEVNDLLELKLIQRDSYIDVIKKYTM